MNTKSFYRKIAYITAVAILLLPLAYLSQPVTGTGKEKQKGKLAELRQEYNLSQAQLGEIDPGSESMKLALFGLHGVAAHFLWEKAHDYKKTKNWDKLEATVKQIVRLQPNFKSVWDFQAHNLSYNVSVEFDNYEHRYVWVKKGIEFLIEGSHYNRDEPIMFWNLGWYTGQKIGNADEKLEFRQLYRDDKPFHDLFRQNGIDVDKAPGADGKPDNWFTARLWYVEGQTAADESGRPIRGKSPLIFHNQPAMSLINGSNAMEKETYEGEVEARKWELAQKNWSSAADEYADYGNRMIPTSWGHPVRLGDYDSILARIQQTEEQLDKLAPGAREKLRDQKLANLPAAERAVFEKKPEDRTAQEQLMFLQFEENVKVNPYEIADQAPPADRPKARQLADQIFEDKTLAQRTNSYRGIINFEYWTQRCAAEQTDTAIEARKHLLAGEEAKKKTDLSTAKKEYEISFKLWKEVFDKYPLIMDNAETQDLVDSISRYNDVLGQLDEDFPTNFILNPLLRVGGEEGQRLLSIQRQVSKEEQPNENPKEDEPKAEEPAKTEEPAKEGEPKEEPKPEADEAKPSEEPKPAPGDQPTEEPQPSADQPAEEPKPATETVDAPPAK